MRATATRLLLAVVVLCSHACFMLGLAFVNPPHHFRRLEATSTRGACRHANTKGALVLAEGNHARKASGAAAPVASSTPLSRARDVFFEPGFRNVLGPMGAAGALLGPNLDNYHSAFGVLTYKNPLSLSVGGHVLVTTDWW